MKKLERELREVRKQMDNALYLMTAVVGDADMTEVEPDVIKLDYLSEKKVDKLQELCDYLNYRRQVIEQKLNEKETNEIRKKKQELYAQLGQLVFINAKYDEENEEIADIEEELLDLIEMEEEQ